MATLRARILTGFAAVTLAGTATAWWLSERFASSLVDRHAALLAGDKAALVSRYFQAENPVWEEWFTDAFYTRAHGYSFTYFDRHGVEGGHSANRPYAVPLSDQARTRPNPHDAAWIEHINQPEPAVVAVYPIYIVRGGHHVTGWVQTLVPLAPQRAGFAWFRVGFATLTAASLGFGALALLALMRPWSRAVSIAAESARHWTPDRTEQAPLLTPRNAPELQPLVDGLNSLLARISDRQRQQQQFLADASHELRTPLTILRGEIEVALRRERAGEEYREVLTSGREELERLSAIVDNLLTLARADAGNTAGERAPVPLIAACEAVAARLADAARQRHVTLAVEGPAEATLDLRPLHLDRLLFNLVENAVHHSPREETVWIRVAKGPHETTIEVTDAGCGIPEEHLPRLFDRFYRVDSARSREHGGAGLGLAIVKSLATLEGGTVSAASRIGHGSVFTVTFPSPPREAPTPAPPLAAR